MGVSTSMFDQSFWCFHPCYLEVIEHNIASTCFGNEFDLTWRSTWICSVHYMFHKHSTYHNCTTIRLYHRMFGADLDAILRAFSATRAHFLLRYLSLPMLVHRLRTIDFQHLYNKMARKLVGWDWKWRLIKSAGRNALVKVVISSQAICHLTPLVVPKGTTKAIIS